MIIVTILFIVFQISNCQNCGPLTTRDVQGPFFEPGATLDYQLVPNRELQNASRAVLLRGKVRERNCRSIAGALVEVWYAGGDPTAYRFPRDGSPMLYRGKTTTDNSGRYNFVATLPGIYSGRPIRHYHYKVTANGRELVTQVYFRDGVPRGYEDYVSGRDSQFPQSVSSIGPGELPDGG